MYLDSTQVSADPLLHPPTTIFTTYPRTNISIHYLFRSTPREAFEFSKRQFQGIYGQQVPVWALLASGSTGGVRMTTPLQIFLHFADLCHV